jgi:UDP-4-amino-4-deoxy-L-arabinose formyltransferase/UDP-glucuronic acid dehydrogenase (UDP-4-keto-hexauronic acid decarboxylating)
MLMGLAYPGVSGELNIVLVAEEAAGAQALRLAARRNHHITAVLTTPEAGPVAAEASKLELPVWPSALVTGPGLGETLTDAGVDLLLNVHSLRIIDEAVLEAPRLGSYNLHPGPLPEYAGLNCPSWAVYHGEESYGVTLHRIAPEVDAGPIAYLRRFDVSTHDRALTVSATCATQGLMALEKFLHVLAGDPSAVPATQQDLSRRRWYDRGPPHAGQVPWGLSGETVTAFVRACDYGPFASPWGRATTRCGDLAMGVVRASRTGRAAGGAAPGTVGATTPDGVEVAAADEWVLVERLSVGGEAVAPAQGLVAGAVLRAVGE